MIRTINVTADDIAKGKRSECERCPIALALERELPPLSTQDSWGTDGLDASLIRGEQCVVYLDLPDACHEFVTRFDNGQFTAPFSFDVDLPADAANYLKLT